MHRLLRLYWWQDNTVQRASKRTLVKAVCELLAVAP